MSRRSKKRKLNNKHLENAWRRYNKAYNEWSRREPPMWHIFSWLKWKSERPYKPKTASEYEAASEEYGWTKDRYWIRRRY